MEIRAEYKKDLSNNYLVLCPQDGVEEKFSLKMLANNNINGLLKLDIKMIDDIAYYYYNITGLKPIKELLELQPLRFSDLKNIYGSIFKLPEIMQEYLLDEKDLLIKPEFIFAGPDYNRIAFCYYPGEGTTLQEQIALLTEYLMNLADYKDKRAVLAVYALHQLSHDSGCSLEKLKEALENAAKGDENPVLEGKEDRKEALERKEDQKETLERKEDQKKAIFKQSKTDYPHMEERVEMQKEVSKYPLLLYLYAAACLTAGLFILVILLKSGLLSDGGKINLIRCGIALFFYMMIEAAAFVFLFRKENQRTDIETSIDYMDWEDEYDNEYISDIGSSAGMETDREQDQEDFKTELIQQPEEEDFKTELLVDFRDQTAAYLESQISGERIYLKSFPFVIGKLKQGVNYVIDNNKISRIHARFLYDDGCYYIEDMDSTNGTSINGSVLIPHERTQVKDLDLVAVADKNYIFHC